MWILHLIPDSFLNIIVNFVILLGIVMIIISFFFENQLLKILPPNIAINPIQQKLFQALSVAVLLTGVYWKGGYGTEMKWRARVAEVEAKLKIAEAQSAKVTEKIVTVTKEKIVYINKHTASVSTEISTNEDEINKGSVLTPLAVKIYNEAVSGPNEEHK